MLNSFSFLRIGIYEFESDKYDLKTFVEIVGYYELLLIVKIDPYHYDNTYLDAGGLPWWLLRSDNQLTNLKYNDTIKTYYMLFLVEFLKFLRQNEFLYSQNGPIITFEIDQIEILSLLPQVFSNSAVFENFQLVTSLPTKSRFINVYKPCEFLNNRKFRATKIDGTVNANKALLKTYEDVINEDLISAQCSFNLMNSHCFYTNVEFSSMPREQHPHHVNLNYIDSAICFIDYKHDINDNHRYLMNLLLANNGQSTIFARQQLERPKSSELFHQKKLLHMTHYLQLNGILNKLDPIVVDDSNNKLNVENFDQYRPEFVYFLYRFNVNRTFSQFDIDKDLINDYALIQCDLQSLVILNHGKSKHAARSVNYKFESDTNCLVLDVLVESMGRLSGYNVNIMKEKKGLMNRQCIRLADDKSRQLLSKLTLYLFDMKKVFVFDSKWSEIRQQNQSFTGPLSLYSRFYLTDMFLNNESTYFIVLSLWAKGIIYLNGKLLARYASSYDCTVHVPYEYLNNGFNEIFVFEMHYTKHANLYLTNRNEFGSCAIHLDLPVL